MSAADLTPPGWKPDPLSDRLARIEGRFDTVDARLDAIDTRFDDLVKYMLWGFGLQSTLLIAVLARVLLK